MSEARVARSGPDGAADALAVCAVRTARGTGTGFAFVRPAWIVTARHVVGDGPRAEPVRLLFRHGGALPARVLFRHPRVDLALLEALGETPCRAPFLPGDPATEPATLFCAGYPPSAGHVVGAYERSKRHRDGHEEVLYKWPVPRAEPGHSGGPLLTARGAVVGVVIDAITLAGQDVLRATSITPLVDELDIVSSSSSF